MQTTTQENDRLLKVNDVAAALSVSGSAVRGWIRLGVIPYIHLPRGGYRIKKSTLEKLMQSHSE